MSLSDHRFIIIHGSFSTPADNWFPWLKEKLTLQGSEVLVPQFPINEEQNLNSWFETFDQEVGELQTNDVLIGHSIGATFALRLMERSTIPIKAAFLISGFTQLLNSERFDSVNHTFTDQPFEWSKIKNKAQKVAVYHSDDDPYVPTHMGEEVARQLDVELTLIPQAKHFKWLSWLY